MPNPLKLPDSRLTMGPSPWVALVCVGITYGLIGWHFSAYSIVWHFSSWFFAMGLTYLLIWGDRWLVNLLWKSSRILVTIFLMSMGLTIAVAFGSLFVVMMMALTSTLYARLELQTAGIKRFWALMIISIVSGVMITAGWGFGQHWFPSSRYWLQSNWLSFNT
jgi:hypothetical protein